MKVKSKKLEAKSQKTPTQHEGSGCILAFNFLLFTFDFALPQLA
jgi:hypothetical protein